MHIFTICTRSTHLNLNLDKYYVSTYVYWVVATCSNRLLGLSTVTGFLGSLDASGISLGSSGFTSQRLH
jgi:hypothetical protein